MPRPPIRALLGCLVACMAAATLPGRAAALEAAALQAALPAAATCREAAPAQLANGRVTASPLPGMVQGRAAGTTGGLGQRQLLVRTTEDHRPGPRAPALPGTLRWAVETAAAEGGGWIMFDPALAGAEIRLAAPLRPGADTTIDGGCTGIRLVSTAAVTLIIIDSTNVIVSGLSLSKDPYQDAVDRTGDAIAIIDNADRVAVLHNAFRRCGDGCIDIVRRERSDRDSRITVAFNRFSDHNKVMLIGTLTCYNNRQAAGCDNPIAHLGDALRSRVFVTIQANLFERTSQRHPKVVSNASVELVNNLILAAATPYPRGRSSAVYGATSDGGGLLLALGNIVGRIDRPTESLAIGPMDAIHAQAEDDGDSTPGLVAGSGNLPLGQMRMAVAEPAQQPQVPPASSQLHVVAVDERNAVAFAACLGRVVGPSGIGSRWPESCMQK